MRLSRISKLSFATALAAAVACAPLLNGCSSAYDEAMAFGVITALPYEVRGCAFLGNVDTPPRMTIENARYDLKLKAAKLGASHLVETYAYGQLLNRLSVDVGVALSGRAYRCPLDVGPVMNNPYGQAHIQYGLPQPTLNLDDRYFYYGR